MTNEQLKAYGAGLTRREVEVLQLIAFGEGNKAIALRLTITLKTVETHIANIYTKIGVRKRTQALTWFFATLLEASS